MDHWPLSELAAVYGIKIKDFDDRGKIVYIETYDKQALALKRSTLQPEELDLEYAICEHIYQRGFPNIARIKLTSQGRSFAQLGQSRFLVTTWLDGEHPDLTDPSQLKLVSYGLAKFHMAARDYQGKVYWQKRLLYGVWPQRFSYRLGHILRYQKLLQAHSPKDEFDRLFLEYCPGAIQAAVKSIESLRNSAYYTLANRSRQENTICHHDLAYHNIIINSLGETGLLDFDYCILDQPLHDLASFILRVVKFSNWTLGPARRILLTYHQHNPLQTGDLDAMFNFLLFPQDFWQLAWAKYSEVGLHKAEYLFVRLQKFIATQQLRQEFLKQLDELCHI